jgi:transcriptional regulator with XRE-family HTH domain
MKNDPVTMRRRLRGDLKRLRLERGLTQRQVADDLYWSQSKVIRIENGSVAIGVTDLQALLRLYGLDDPAAVAGFVEMARGSRKLPFNDYRDLFSQDTLRYFAYESSASIIRQVETLLVPGLLQTEEYADALLSAWGLDKKRIAQIWASRAERQEVLDRGEVPQMFFILDEAVVMRPVGGEGVMKKQRARMLELSARPEVTIQVLPLTVGGHSGLRSPFVYLEFGDTDDQDVLFLEGALGDSVFRDDEAVTSQFLDIFFELERLASPPNELEKALGGLQH